MFLRQAAMGDSGEMAITSKNRVSLPNDTGKRHQQKLQLLFARFGLKAAGQYHPAVLLIDKGKIIFHSFPTRATWAGG
jgi:hypothetical protein